MGINKHFKNPRKAYIYAGLSVLFWSTAASAFKLTLDHINFIQVLFIATLTSCLALFLVLFFQKKVYLLRQTAGKEYLYSALLGFLNPFLYYLILLKAYSLLPAQVAQPLNFTWPIMLVILSVPLLGQRISLSGIGTMFISFTGVYLISTQGNPLDPGIADPLGVTLALGSSVIWALFWIYNVRDSRNEVVKLFLSFCFAILYTGTAMMLSSGFMGLKWTGVAGAIYIGLFEMGFTFIFWLKALQYAESTDRVSNLIYITPFLALLLINLVVGEHIHVTTIGGLILIVAGIVLHKFLGGGKAKYKTFSA
jgi:drug/metabolite transporter (DMT)-like permease